MGAYNTCRVIITSRDTLLQLNDCLFIHFFYAYGLFVRVCERGRGAGEVSTVLCKHELDYINNL